MDAEASEQMLNRMTPKVDEEEGSEEEAEENENDGIDRVASVDWKKAREGSIARRPWFRRPSPYW